MNRIGFYIIAATVALPAASLASIAVNAAPRQPVAFKAADEAQSAVYAATERVERKPLTAPAWRTAPAPSALRAEKRSVARPAAKPLPSRREECRLRPLEQGGSPSAPFVAECVWM